MPVSKSGNLFYTEDQYKIARYESSALDYARSQGYDLVPSGKYFTLREHDSMVFTDRGGWFWNSHNIQGGAIEFMTVYEHKPLVEAVLTLAGERVHEQAPYIPPPKATETPPTEARQESTFTMPERNDDHRRAYAYLTKTRGIDPDLVSTLIKQGKLYEGKDYHNAVFAFENSTGEYSGAFLRSTNTLEEKQFRGMAKGYDRGKSYFVFGGSPEAEVACVFEAAIDAMSYATLQKLGGNTALDERFYIATGGAGTNNALAFLTANPQVKNVILCQDNDDAGNNQADALGAKLRAMGLQVTRVTPNAKDFNEDLLAVNQSAQKEEKKAIPEAKPETLDPDDFLTGDRIKTPRGSFSLTSMTAEQMKAAGYAYHHSSDKGDFHIMANGTRAFAIINPALLNEMDAGQGLPEPESFQIEP